MDRKENTARDFFRERGGGRKMTVSTRKETTLAAIEHSINVRKALRDRAGRGMFGDFQNDPKPIPEGKRKEAAADEPGSI